MRVAGLVLESRVRHDALVGLEYPIYEDGVLPANPNLPSR
jgi:hypothetical protein